MATSMSDLAATGSNDLRNARPSMNRERVLATAEGGALALTLWCVLLAFELLPGIAVDGRGIVLFTIVGMILGAWRGRRVLIALIELGAVAVFLVSLTPASNIAIARWTRSDVMPDTTLSAVIVLSASVNGDTTISDEALDHLMTGLELIHAGKAQSLVTTTVNQPFPQRVVSSAPDQARVIGLFSGHVNWIRVPAGQSTRDEAVASARELLPRGINRIAVVASPLHTRRACATFEAMGFSVTCVPSRARALGGRDPGGWPPDRLRAFGTWIYEVAALAKYRAEGWISRRHA